MPSKLDEAEASFRFAKDSDGGTTWMLKTMCNGLVLLCQAVREMQAPTPPRLESMDEIAMAEDPGRVAGR